MHDDRVLVESRIARILRERVRPAIHGARAPLDVGVWHAPGEPVPVAEALAADFVPAAAGQEWGPAWGTSWFHVTGSVPADWAGRPVEAVVDLGFGGTPGFSAEGLVHRPDGTAIKALNPFTTWVRVDPSQAVDLYVEAAANPTIGYDSPVGDRLTAGSEPLYRVRRVELAIFEEGVFELDRDVDVAWELMHELPVDSPRRWDLLRALERALDVALDWTDVPGTAAAARAELAGVLARPAHASAHRISAVGHAHIDSAWLWPLRETVRKVARTVSNVTDLMDGDPGFVFAMSSAQQWAWMQEHRPDVWERMKAKVASGQLLPVGGMWVESDTNMPGGEALARQLVHGKRFFLDELGVETEEIWLPDSFGYTAAFPQLVTLSGSRWFLTQKISWSQFNRFPHHSFRWEGLDGTRVFTHFPPVDTYNSELSGRELAHASRNFADKGGATRSLVPFGWGDGGGGPTREMLARAARTADLEGSPRVTIEAPSAFFAAAEAEYPDAPVWAGELYLELHRGTYTSQAKNKQGNRRAEHLLREVELWSATAAVRTGYAYPYERLDALWKTVLLHQFHDILPGSSIAWVHRESRETYARITAETEQLITGALRALAGDGETELVANAAPHARNGVAAGALGPSTATPHPDERHFRHDLSAESAVRTLENGLLRVTLDERGLLTSVVDLATGREAIAPGAAANLLQIHPDLPANWDAWDVDPSYRRRVTDLVHVDALEQLENGVRVTRRFGESTAVQTVTLAPGARRVDCALEVDWHASETFLKATFPLDVRAQHSSSEIQFGYVERAAHTNTSWDAAKFEICAHRFLHVGEPGFGVALVNDSTYGHDVTRDVRADGGTTTTVRLSLLRAPRYPDPETDQGVHVLRWALVPGARIADATREGWWINLPERRLTGAGPVEPLVTCADDGVVLSAVKLADDGSGDVVVRVHEALGGRATARLAPGFPAGTVTETDLLERPQRPGSLDLTLRPFQIMTLRIARA